MSEKKKKIDKIFLIITLISFLTFLFLPEYALDIVSGVVLGFVGPSFGFMMSLRRLESEQIKKVYTNLFKNIIIYLIIMIIAIQISNIAFAFCVITLTVYRYLFINELRRWKEE